MKTPKWFDAWKRNDFWHLEQKVKLNTRLLWIILGTLIAASVLERLG